MTDTEHTTPLETGDPPPLSATELENALDDLGRPTWRVRLNESGDVQLLHLVRQLFQAETSCAVAADDAGRRVKAELTLAIEGKLIAASIAYEVRRWRDIKRIRAEALIANLDCAGAAFAALCAAWREWLDASWTQPLLKRARARVQVVRAERAGAALQAWLARSGARERKNVLQLPEAELQHLHACAQALYKLDVHALFRAAETPLPNLQNMWWAVDAARDLLPREVNFRAEMALTRARVGALMASNDGDDGDDGSVGADGSDGQGQTPAADRPTGT